MRHEEDKAEVTDLLMKTKQFEYDTCVLGSAEYAKIISEINTNYGLYVNQPYSVHCSVGLDGRYYLYYFENHGFNNYNIVEKIEIK